jgi:UDP-glucose 4-epimerase
VRDYVHVVDIADAHLRALEYLLAKRESCALNLANSHGYSVKEVIAAAERVCGRTVKVKVEPRRLGDPPILVGSANALVNCSVGAPDARTSRCRSPMPGSG